MHTHPTSEKLLVLIDGSSYLYRAYHALPALTNSHGEPTGAIYGVINMIRKLLTDFNPDYIGVVFDAKGTTFRDNIFPAYKAHRPAMPEDLQKQTELLQQAIRAMGLPLITLEGIEADDVIATLTDQGMKKNWKILISTGDKDIAQLVNEQITLINTMTGTILDREGVIKKFDVTPEQIIDYLSLIGDSSDNIPGVPKVGPKTASKWLKDFGSLHEIINHAEEFSGKIGENLRNSIPQLALTQQLVTLQRDVPLPLTVDQLEKKAPDRAALLELFKRLEFKSWLNELLETETSATAVPVDYQMILTEEALNHSLEQLKHAESFAFNIETTSANTLDAEIVGLSFSIKSHQAVYVPLAHNYIGAEEQLACNVVLEKFKPLLQEPQKKLIVQNLKYVIGVLTNYGLNITTTIFDTMLESYLLDSTSSHHDLHGMSLKYLGKRFTSLEEIAGKGAKQLSFNQIPLEKASVYAAEKADMILQIHEVLWPKISQNSMAYHVLLDIDLPLARVLSRMERAGVLIDRKKLAAQSSELEQRLKKLENQAHQLAGAVFNLSSPKQLQDILYNKLKLPQLSKTPTGAASTAESVLQELALNYPLPKLILEHRSLCKIKTTYTDTLPHQIHAKTGRVHTSYNQAVTSTGRLSSTDPNLQNIPIRNEEGRRIRQAFIAPLGYKIISADYSQIELRIMAHLSQDPGLLHAFANDHDIHTATAAEVFSTPLSAVTPEQRRHAKAINFGLIYGMSAFGLSRQLSVERDVALAYIDQYFSRYPKVKYLMQAIQDQAAKQGYVETLLSRRLYVPDIKSSQLQRRRAAERAAINAPMQGTAADIIKIAMIRLDAWQQDAEIKAKIKMIMQVHDELVFEVADSDVETAITAIRDRMVHAFELSVPLAVNIGVGNNWDEAHA